MLRDTLTGSAHGLETVIKVTASVAPLPLRADTDILVSNLGGSRWTTPCAPSQRGSPIRSATRW